MKLSLAIPTLNRRELLASTLEQMLEQLDEAVVEVELMVFDNASDDETAEMFQAPGGRFSAIRYHRFEDRVGIDASFARTVSNCGGDYILLFGDDDVPLPGFLREVTRTLRECGEPALVYVNRLIGDSSLGSTREIAHPENPYGRSILPAGKFVERFTHGPGFVSSLIFSRRAWDRGSEFARAEYDGYAFLARLYWGARDEQTVYVGAPLLIQRRGVQAWKKDWPDYWLISMPRMLERLDHEGMTETALEKWRRDEVGLKGFIKDCVMAKAFKHDCRSPFWSESRRYHSDGRRKLISIAIQYLVHEKVALAAFKAGARNYRKVRL